jgi:predicted AAA+ superfamily ATPase
LVDPALALSLLGHTKANLIKGGVQLSVGGGRDNSLFGRLFESLVSSSLKVYASKADAQLYHFRTADGRHEVDFIVERGDALVAIEVKLGTQVVKKDVDQLNWG